jgi:hypothetical protein
VGHSDPARVIRLAVLDDITPANRGDVIEYWRGETEFEPTGRRKQAFDAARSLSDMGRVVLCQEQGEVISRGVDRNSSTYEYSYRMVVV